jgi:hypothetical protein
MFNSLDKIDWNLLHEQKLALLAMRKKQHDSSSEFQALSGIIHLLDALQDDAVADGRWTFPNANDEEVYDVQA